MAFNKKVLIVPLLAIGLLGAASSADAWKGGPCGGPDYGPGYGAPKGGPGYGPCGPCGPCGPGPRYKGWHHGGPGWHHGGPGWYDSRAYDEGDFPPPPPPAPRDDMRGDFPPPPPPADRGPDFTPEQQAQYDSIVADFNAKAQPLRDQLFVKRQELRALENAPQPNVAQVTKTAEEVVQLRGQLRELRGQLLKNLQEANLHP